MTDSFAPRSTAQAVFDDRVIRPTSLVNYASQGRLLVLGNSEQIAAVWQRLPDNLTPAPMCADNVTLHGWLGAFQVQGQTGFDLVLDLTTPPVINLPVLPPGYFAPQNDAQSLEQALEQLAELVGEFDKPKYFNYRPDICAHHTVAVRGCQACIDVCGAAAIRAGNDGRVEVTPHLCQGCGDCTTACPSGAMGYAYPLLGDTLNRLRLMLEAWRQAGGAAAPVVLFYGGDQANAIINALALPEWLLAFPLEALAAAGMEVWLSAMAYGAAGVWLLDDGSLSRLTKTNLEQQLSYAKALLLAMGYDADCLRLVASALLIEETCCTSSPPHASSWLLPPSPLPLGEGGVRGNKKATGLNSLTPATHAGQDDKRTALRLALEHLYRHASQQPPTALLSDGAPFGQIIVEASRCTLCMACVSACPVGALQDGHEQPQLKFIENNCVQCERCANACPENAIALQARYLFDAQSTRQPRLLHQADVFCCVECGKPFASATMIRSITDKLQQHSMFQGSAARRLQMCEDCRVNAHFKDL